MRARGEVTGVEWATLGPLLRFLRCAEGPAGARRHAGGLSRDAKNKIGQAISSCEIVFPGLIGVVHWRRNGIEKHLQELW